MLSINEFENLLQRSESTILDFKASFYDFSDDIELKSISKFVKDVISFCNTVRNETSYIIIGVEESKEGGKVLHGLTQDIDDSILQQKIKNKVYPIPTFHYYSIIYQLKKFGVLEFPIFKYSVPITPVAKLKGLEIGKVYYRQGTSNTEALGLETIRINDWLKSLPEFVENNNNVTTEINKLIKDLASSDKKLSGIFADMYTVAHKYKLLDLMSFCSQELKGIDSSRTNNDQSLISYRIQNVFISHQNVEVNPYFNITTNFIKKEFEKNENFFQTKLLFTQSIIDIEGLLKKFQTKPDNTLGSIKMNHNDLFSDSTGSDFKIIAYFFNDTISSLYGNIRQKAIDKLMRIS